MKESLVVSSSLKWLSVHNIMAWRNNSGAYKAENGAYIRFGCPGSPDIIAIQNGTGRFMGIECKSDKGKLTPHQIEFQRRSEWGGALYFMVRSIDDLERFKVIITGDDYE